MPSFPGAAAPDPSVIGGVSVPPFARLPDPAVLFARRAARLDALAQGHALKPYLLFLRDLVAAQGAVLDGLPEPDMPDADALERARRFAMPPLDRNHFTLDAACETTLERVLSAAVAIPKPEAAARALEEVRSAAPAARDEMVRNVLASAMPVETLAAHVYVAAALQVHFARLAARLDAKALVPVGDGLCPCCGGPPVASLVVGWPEAHGARYCACALCGTLWNFVRVRCTTCGSTKGIGLTEVEGGPGTVKAETCDHCHTYSKVLYQTQDPDLEPMADDVASLALDLMLKEGPYRRAAFNPFLLGY